MDMLHAYIEDGEHSVLFSTHITVDLERAADFITYITGGRLYYTGPKDEFEESFRIVKGGPGELAQLPAGVVLGSHTYQTMHWCAPTASAPSAQPSPISSSSRPPSTISSA